LKPFSLFLPVGTRLKPGVNEKFQLSLRDHARMKTTLDI
jgi:hypothetical protein